MRHSLLLRKPLFQRRLAFAGGFPGKKVFDANVFVQVGPMNSLSLADQTPIAPLGNRSMRQPRIPCQGHSDRPPVGKLDGERVVGDLNVDNL